MSDKLRENIDFITNPASQITQDIALNDLNAPTSDWQKKLQKHLIDTIYGKAPESTDMGAYLGANIVINMLMTDIKNPGSKDKQDQLLKSLNSQMSNYWGNAANAETGGDALAHAIWVEAMINSEFSQPPHAKKETPSPTRALAP